jgi:hypothetical protein
MRTIVRMSVALAVAGLAVAVAAPAAVAQTDEEPDNIVVLTGRAEVRTGETVDNVIIADGPVVVDGTVRDAVVALNGDVLVRGTAEEDVVAVDGRVTIADGGRVAGDVVSRHEPTVEPGGQFEGSWERWDPRAWSDAASIVGWLGLWLAVSVSTLVLGLVLLLLAPRAALAVDEAAGAIGPVILWGLALLIGLPIVAVIAMVTLVGLPLGLGLLLALGLIYHVGYTAGGLVLGRRVARGVAPPLSFLAGWGILRAVALVPVLGGLAWLAATVVGLGAIAVAGYRGRRRAVAEAATDAPQAAPGTVSP